MVGPLAGALAADVEDVRETAAEGGRSGALVSMYPPGVPLLLCREVIDAASLVALAAVVEAGARVTGSRSDGTELLVLQESTPSLVEASQGRVAMCWDDACYSALLRPPPRPHRQIMAFPAPASQEGWKGAKG